MMEPVAPGKTRVGWIGTGVMGAAMAGHIRDAGYELAVYNRTRAKAEPLLAKGAVWADTPGEVAGRCDVVFTMVGFPADLRQVVLEAGGVAGAARPGSVLVDMTTSEPALARELYDALKARGIASVDAPVSGGDVGARNAALSIMVGGDREVVEALMPLFKCMGKLIVHHGPAGAGQHAKMCNQILIASTMIAVCECLLYGYKAGLDLKKVIESVGSGAAGSWAINNLGPRILKRDFDPGFFVEHFVKDMGIALGEAKRMGIVLPGLALANQLYLSVTASGHGRSGTQALMLALERMSDVQMERG
jgi:3-hydroxyisobutyrate dehydrogenase